MAHEELIEQYSKDCTEHLRPWELWQYRFKGEDRWRDFFNTHPKWLENVEYRRKEPPFEPEYFSGLNWRDALRLVGRVVEFSDRAETWVNPFKLQLKEIDVGCKFPFICENGRNYNYIRTCPETHAHPTVTLTVNGREWVLPMPETEAPERGIDYWIVDTYEIDRYKWQDGEVDREWLEVGIVHLVEDRAQAWADFWREAILGELK